MSHELNLSKDVLDYDIILKKCLYELKDMDASLIKDNQLRSLAVNIDMTTTSVTDKVVDGKRYLSVLISTKVESRLKKDPDSSLFNMNLVYRVVLEVSKSLSLDLGDSATERSIVVTSIALVNPTLRESINRFLGDAGLPKLKVPFGNVNEYERND